MKYTLPATLALAVGLLVSVHLTLDEVQARTPAEEQSAKKGDSPAAKSAPVW